MKSKITYLLILCCFASLFLAACGDNKAMQEKAAYKEALMVYYDQINLTSASINAVDVSQPGGSDQILGYLDTMSISFAGLASVQTPDRYEPLMQLTAEANADFTAANAIYHEIYGDASFANFDSDKATEAAIYYQSAMSKLVQLGRSLMADEDPSSESTSNQASDTSSTTNETVSSN